MIKHSMYIYYLKCYYYGFILDGLCSKFWTSIRLNIYVWLSCIKLKVVIGFNPCIHLALFLHFFDWVYLPLATRLKNCCIILFCISKLFLSIVSFRWKLFYNISVLLLPNLPVQEIGETDLSDFIHR